MFYFSKFKEKKMNIYLYAVLCMYVCVYLAFRCV